MNLKRVLKFLKDLQVSDLAKLSDKHLKLIRDVLSEVDSKILFVLRSRKIKK